jgi:hypothetical protein
MSKGRPSKYGKNNDNMAAIVADLQNPKSATPYYIQKLIDMGYMQITLTQKGQEILEKA